MKLMLMIVAVSTVLTACSSSDKKEPPAYFFAKEGAVLVVPEGARLPDMQGALTIPSASQPLSEYNPKLADPPNIITGTTE